MQRRFENKRALITGASSGIGRAIAVRFAAEGARVAINHFNDPSGAEETLALCGGAGVAVHADVSDEASVARLFSETVSSLGGVDILINNAGILGTPASHDITMTEFDRVMGVNLRGAFLCCREAVRHFLARSHAGVIVNNSSVHETIPKPKYTAYSLSKMGMEGLTKSLALEYAGNGIRVNAVGPGAVITPMNNAWKDDPAARAGVESHIPLGRAAEAEEIAAVFAFLASDEASYITGQTLFACGGLSLYPEFRSAWASGE